ncbi:MAG: choice-of-anchor B family protein [Saprospiraceae bacterium]|nr:choice-of-anchor B family protein [Saprospiraceae bacterium]
MKKLFSNFLGLALMLVTFQGMAQNANLELRATVTYPGQTLANICGYAQNGREYALVGASKGLVIVDVTDPVNPVNIVQIPGPDNLWKEIKTYQNYAYITSEGGGGLQIVDLSDLPSDNLQYHSYTGDGIITGQLNSIHALHIDVTKGFVYLYGSNLYNGGAVVLDLNADPFNPTFAGKFDQLGYIHDGFADNDTLYAGHIYTGLLSIVDMTDKSAPELLGTVQTPGKFTHNAWLTDDHKHILTTDETTPSFLTSYDISDPTDIIELDRFSTNDGYNSYGHNTHILNDYAVTSWYTDGLNIVDAHRPDNLVLVGSYDTWAGSGASFDGCWGVYPYLPSGNILATNIEPGQLFVLSPTYVRACYLEGTVKSGCTGLPLSDVEISVNSNDPYINTTTNPFGVFKTGQHTPGTYTVTISKVGFDSQTFDVTLATGEVVDLDVTLESPNAYTVNGTVVDGSDNTPIGNAPMVLSNGQQSYDIQTNANGQFNLTCVLGGDYQVTTAAWGYLPGEAVVNSNGAITVSLENGYYDDFSLDLGWTVNTDASAGFWTLDAPLGTTYQNDEANTGADVDFDGNNLCYITGNGGGAAGNDDVDNGTVTLTTPVVELGNYEDGILSFWYWFFNDGGQGTPNDQFEVRVSSGGLDDVLVFSSNESQSTWRFSGEINLKNFVPMSDDMYVSFITSDVATSGHLVEAAVDAFRIVPTGLSSGTNTPSLDVQISVLPNPSTSNFRLNYNTPNSVGNLLLDVRHANGQHVQTISLNAASGQIILGAEWPAGVYFATMRSADGQTGKVVKLVKS